MILIFQFLYKEISFDLLNPLFRLIFSRPASVPKVESALPDRIYRFYGVVYPLQQNVESCIKEKHLRQRKFFQADLM